MKYLVNRETKEHAVYEGHPETDRWRIVEADSEGWIPWHGGECPLPDDAKTEIKHRSGAFEKPEKARHCIWSLHSKIYDIIAYRPTLSEQSKPDVKQSLTTDLLTRLRAAQEASKDFDAALAELSEQLCELGYKLVPINTEVTQEVTPEDMSDWRNWGEGDVIEFGGKLCTLDCITNNGAWLDFHSERIFATRTEIMRGEAKFHSRPKVQS